MKDYNSAVVEILKENGCWKIRDGKGDHEYWCCPNSPRPFPVDGKIKSRHTANGIMKQARIKHHFP